MAYYPNPIATNNPFWTDYPWVIAVRHVRVVGAETVVEDANQLPRRIMRVVNKRAYPLRTQGRTLERNVPFNETEKGPYL